MLPARLHPAVLVSCLLSLTASAAGWSNGPVEYQQHIDCLNGSIELFSMSTSGYWRGDGSPKVGEVYYVRSNFTVLGNACRGGGDVLPEFVLPANTHLSVSDTNRVRCWYRKIGGQTASEESDCPQVPSTGTYGLAFRTGFSASGHFPVAQGWEFEMWVPVISTAPLNAIRLVSPQHLIFDHTAWVFPEVAVTVLPNPPTISHPSPATTEILETSAVLNARVDNHYAPGTLFVERGYTSGFELPPDEYTLGAADAYLVTHELTGLEPGTPYHWRMRFVAVDGTTTLGPEETFTTAGVRAFPLSVSAGAGGSVWTSPASNRYPAGTTISVTAQPEAGYQFEGWQVDGEQRGRTNPLQLQISQAHVIHASFSRTPDAGTGAGGNGSVGGGSGGGSAPEPEELAPGCSCRVGGSATPLLWALGIVAFVLRRRLSARREAA